MRSAPFFFIIFAIVMMTEIITSLVSSGVIVAVVETAASWRRKKAEGKASDYDAQKKGLDLVSEYYERIRSIDGEQSRKMDSISAKMDTVIDDVGSLRRDMNDITDYLNGGLKDWKKHKYRIQDLDR